MTSTSYLDRLAARSAAVGSVLCLGLDPDPTALPDGFSRDVVGIEAFARLVLDACLPHVAAVKPNLAFYEAFGSAGVAVLERLRARIPGDVPLILDAKRADIGSTSARLAVALFDALGADAVTLNPYLGRDAIAPLLESADRYAYILCRTSNPGADELQGLVVEGADVDAGTGGADAANEPLAYRVARTIAGWPEASAGTVGLVVGATAPRELAAIRALVPGLGFLVPGLGAQGGDLEAVREFGPAGMPPAGGRPGGGLVVNVGRGILGAAVGADDPAGALAEAARAWSERLPVLA
ncbi:MAG TPA: orotidine-5'-phosphate decarboxylase [Candidatus Limnocylindrales bacterium]|nr:orotidine-5'-phosphate decarboxylase [Candidatus Limnocylindrales bacterium]